jgi:RNA polymerase sigma-70 factor (ECF subfamily)
MGRGYRGSDDATLVHRAREGDASAFETLARRHYRAAYAVARARVDAPMDAEDVVQEAFMRALERLDDCDPESFRGWLLTIVRNRAHNARIYQARRRGPDPETMGGAQLAADDDSARGVEVRDLRGALERALGTLSDIQREVLLLHDLEGLKHAEIADMAGVTVGMSRYHLMQARRAMRESLGPGAPETYGHDG